MEAAERSHPKTVGIVGGGFAGLRCAEILLQHGCEVTIFEARDRLGGRVAQSKQLGHLVDLGPNWLHGTTNNSIFDIATSTGTNLHAWPEVSEIISSTGRPLTPSEANEHISLLWDDDGGLIDEAFAYSKSHRNTDQIDPNLSLYDFFVSKSADLFKDEASPAEAERKREDFLQTTRMWGAYVGSDITRQSLRFFWLEKCTTESEMPFVAETYHKILENVARPAKEGARIRFGCEVVGIVSGGSEDQGGRARIETADGTKESFDAVVVTCPLGWLKQNQSAFHPPLPPDLAQAIDNIGYGTLDKVYITFPSPFWDALPPHSQNGTIIHGFDEEGKPHHSLTSQKTSPSDVLFLTPSYAHATNPQSWPQECLTLTALPTPYAHSTLLFYIFGECSRYIASLPSSTSIQNSAACDEAIINFFKPYFSLLPNYNSTNSSCIPTAVLATAWAKDKFAGYGSYSNFPVGLERADKDVERMTFGMPERSIWLAGEHTAPLEALGTTGGAWLSGEDVAERILIAHGRKDS